MRNRRWLDFFLSFLPCTWLLTLEMSFVPAGYYDNSEEDDGFDFGDSYNPGDCPVEVAKSSKEANIVSPGPPNGTREQPGSGEDVSANSKPGESYIKSASHHAPAKESKGSLFSADSFSDTSQESSTLCHGNQEETLSTSPVKFDISGGQFDLSTSSEACEVVSVREYKHFNSLKKVLNGPTDSSSLDSAGSKGRMKRLEMLEEMKVALSRGSIEQVERLLNEGML